MTERAEQIAGELDGQFSQMIELVSGLTGPQLDAACVDSQGSTVGAVLKHLRDGTDLLLEWAGDLTGTSTAADPAPVVAADHGHSHGHGHGHGHSHDHGHSHGHDPADAAKTAEHLRVGGSAFVGAVRALSDDELVSFPAKKESLTDGSMRLDAILLFIVDDLAAHRSHLVEALTVPGKLPQAAR